MTLIMRKFLVPHIAAIGDYADAIDWTLAVASLGTSILAVIAWSEGDVAITVAVICASVVLMTVGAAIFILLGAFKKTPLIPQETVCVKCQGEATPRPAQRCPTPSTGTSARQL